MPRAITITCGNCGQNISEGGPMPSWRIFLDVQRLHNPSNVEYSVFVSPPTEPDWFCSVPCLIEKLS